MTAMGLCAVSVVLSACTTNAQTGPTGTPTPASGTPTSTPYSSPSSSPSSSPANLYAARCAHGDLHLAQGRTQGVNSAEDLLGFRVINIGSRTCRVHNYPDVAFLNARGRIIPFNSHPAKPGPPGADVVLRPGKPTWFGLGVGICFAPPVTLATTVRFTFPHTNGTYTMRLRGGAVMTRRGPVAVNGLPYCRGARTDVGVFPISGT